MLVQIVVDALEELLTTHIEHELLQHGSALSIGDAVEVDIRVVQIVDRRDDRVGGAQLILAQCPALLAGAERGPSVLPFRGFGSGKGGRELGERLVKPQVVPPLHGHVIAEPHVCKLVQHCDDAALGIRVGDLRFEHVLVADGDHANVLHSAGIVFRHVNLVVLGVRIRHAPSLRIEGKTLLGDVEQVVDILGERFGERLTAVHGHRHGASVFVGVFGMPFGVWACADGGEIGAHGRRGFEHPQLGGFGFVRAERAFFGNGFAVGHGCGRHVGGDNPRLGGEHGEVEHGLDVRLVEHGVHADGSTLRCRPSPVLEYWHSALTVTSLCASRFFSSIRLSANASAGSRVAPLSTISLTSVAIRSRKLVAPGSASNVMVVSEPKFLAPQVRSSLTV